MNFKTKYIVQAFVIIFFTGIGFFLGSKPVQQRNSVDIDYNSQTISELEEKFKLLSKNEFADYLQLKNQKLKYEKAEEILGKMMLIFLTDLGLKASSQHQTPINSLTLRDNAEENAKDRSNQPNGDYQKNNKMNSLSKNSSEPSSENQKLHWSKNEAKFSDVRSEKDIQSFLSSVVIKDLFSEMRSANKVSEMQLDELNGQFIGKVIFDSKSREPWDVFLDLKGDLKNGILDGTSLVELSKNGKAFSTSRSNGNLDENFKSFAGSSEAILVSANRERSFFQLYLPNKLNKLIGNYYSKKSVGQYVKEGYVVLERK